MISIEVDFSEPCIFYRKADCLYPQTVEKVIFDCDQDALIKRLSHHRSKPPVSLSLKQRGLGHEIYKVVWDDRVDVLKVARCPQSSLSLRSEAFVQQWLCQHKAPVAQVWAYFEPFEGVPGGGLWMEAVEGCHREAFSEKKDDFYEALRQEGRAVGLCHGLGRSRVSRPYGFGILQMKPTDSCDGLRGPWSSWREYILSQLTAHVTFCRRTRLISPAEQSRILTAFQSSMDHWEAYISVTILHGDLGGHNFLHDDRTKHVKTVLDWEDALIGDPVFDIAGWASFYRMDECLQPFLEGYDEMFPHSGRSRSFDARFWIYYLRIVLAKAVHRIRWGYDRPGHASVSREKIVKALAHLHVEC